MEENNKSDQKMYYRMLGGTGLQVSVLSFGFWATYGVKDGLTNEEGITSAKECMSLARQKGINLFDNAETYGNPAGAAEEIMGEAMAQLQKEDPKIWKRSEIIVSTKIFWGGVGVNERGLSRKHINEGLDAALKRLQVNYVDLLFCHRPDPFTPTETVVRSMTDIVRSGRATAWGTSEWSAQQITEAFPWDTAPKYLLRDRDRIFGDLFQRRICSMGIKEVMTAYRSPWQNAYVERLNGSIRRECTDHVIIWNERHLKKVLREYFDYYNNDRTHLGINKESPTGRQVAKKTSISDRLVELPKVGGLHHRYEWRTAA